MMSDFFSNPLFIAATHDERVRRLRGASRPRRDERRLPETGTDSRKRRRRG
jgi:hypothetical protein